MSKFFRFVFCLFYTCHLFANDTGFASQIELAQDKYDQGDFKSSVLTYEALLEKNLVSGEVLFNLGNSYFRMGEKGKAIAAYLAAKRYLPRDPDIKHNLKYVHSESKDKLTWEPKENIFSILTFWIHNVTSLEIKRVCLLLWCLALLFLILERFFKFLSPFKSLGTVLLLCSVVCFALFQTSVLSENRWGAVSDNLVKIRSGPGENNTVLFELNEGAPFMVRDDQKGWYRIELSDTKKGWIKKEKTAVF